MLGITEEEGEEGEVEVSQRRGLSLVAREEQRKMDCRKRGEGGKEGSWVEEKGEEVE